MKKILLASVMVLALTGCVQKQPPKMTKAEDDTQLKEIKAKLNPPKTLEAIQLEEKQKKLDQEMKESTDRINEIVDKNSKEWYHKWCGTKKDVENLPKGTLIMFLGYQLCYEKKTKEFLSSKDDLPLILQVIDQRCLKSKSDWQSFYQSYLMCRFGIFKFQELARNIGIRKMEEVSNEMRIQDTMPLINETRTKSLDKLVQARMKK